MIVHWGAAFAVDIATADPLHRSRDGKVTMVTSTVTKSVTKRRVDLPTPTTFCPRSWPTMNGLVDTTVPIEHIRSVQRACAEANATTVVRPLPNQPRGCWDANVAVDGVVVRDAVGRRVRVHQARAEFAAHWRLIRTLHPLRSVICDGVGVTGAAPVKAVEKHPKTR
jgi:hypothetical protein